MYNGGMFFDILKYCHDNVLCVLLYNELYGIVKLEKPKLLLNNNNNKSICWTIDAITLFRCCTNVIDVMFAPSTFFFYFFLFFFFSPICI